MNKYDDAMSKMALGLTSAQVAKNYIVEDFGIGEDLPFTFFFWQGGDLLFAAQMKREFMLLAVEDRLSHCGQMAALIASSFMNVSAITFVAEAFETLDKTRLDGRDLRTAFVEEKDLVRECLTITHCERNAVNGELELTLASLPYEYNLGRSIEWGAPLGFVGGVDKVLKTSAVSRVLLGALSVEPEILTNDADIEALFSSLTANGFNIQGF